MTILVQSDDLGRRQAPSCLREDPWRRHQRATAADECRETLGALGLAQHRVAQLFGVGPRSVRRWQDGDRGVPCGVGIVLRLLAAGAVTIAQVEQAAIPVDAQANSSAEPGPPVSLPVERAPEQAVVPVPARVDSPPDSPERPAPLLVFAPVPERSTLVGAEAATLGASSLITAEKICALTPQACRWPHGDPRHSEFHFCGNPVVEKPYCATHRALAYVAPRTDGRHGAGAGLVAQWSRHRPKTIPALPRDTHPAAAPVAVSVPPARAPNRRSVR